MKKTKNNNEAAFDLIIDEMEGNLSQDQKNELQKWISSDPENERIYQEFYLINRSFDTLSVYNSLNPDASWDSLNQKVELSSTDSGIVHTIPKNKHIRSMWWLAAAAMLIAVISIPLYSLFNPYLVTISTAENQHTKISLPDGSYITLNENTTLQYNKNKYVQNRELNLIHGEAFFYVVHNPRKTFRVNIGDLRITDIGTSFNVKKSEAEISVIVNSGKVAFENLSSHEQLILDKGEKGIYNVTAKQLIDTPNLDANYKSWLDKKLSFNNTPLTEVVKQLEKTYGYKVILKDSSLQTRRLNATLNYQTIDSALTVISAGLKLKVNKVSGQYILDYSK